jgi:hypothetical protein
MVFNVKEGLTISSVIYKIFKEGIAMKISNPIGREVQNNSISWFSMFTRVKKFLDTDDQIK